MGDEGECDREKGEGIVDFGGEGGKTEAGFSFLEGESRRFLMEGNQHSNVSCKFCFECMKSIPLNQWMYNDLNEFEKEDKPFEMNRIGIILGRVVGEFVMWLMRSVYFREVTVVGKENVPPKGAAIFYGNHQNQFIDPLMMNSYVNRKLRFLMAAKSLKQPVIGTLGRMFESVPVMRPQDVPVTPGRGKIVSVEGVSIKGEGTDFTQCLKVDDFVIWYTNEGKTMCRHRVKKIIDDMTLEVRFPVEPSGFPAYPFSFSTTPRIDQDDMYLQVYETLKKGECIGIFPEGGSHDNTSLLPLKAGVALFSLAALDRGINIKIVPVGLTYLHGHKFRSRAYVEIGKPIVPPQHLVQLYRTNRREATTLFLNQLHEALKAITINVPDYATLKFLHDFRQLCQPLNCSLPPKAYLQLIHRLAHVIDRSKEEKDFQEFRKRVEEYASRRNNLYLKDSQVATLKYLSGEARSKYAHLLIKRGFTFIVLLSILFPFLVLGIPLGCCVEYFATQKTRKAVKESTVKIVGADVKGSFRIVISFIFLPLTLLFATTCVYFLSNIYAATAVLISLPMAMYISLLICQEAQIEVRAMVPLILYLFSTYSERYNQLYSLRKELAVQAQDIIQRYDPFIIELMEMYHKDTDGSKIPSIFSIRHNIRRRHEFDE